MSELNHDIISDTSLRQLLQLYMLEGDEHDILTQQIIDMETTFVLGTDAFAIQTIPGEKLFLNKLKSGLSKGLKFKWILSGVIAMLVGSSLYFSVRKSTTDTMSSAITLPQIEQESQTAIIKDSAVAEQKTIPIITEKPALSLMSLEPRVQHFNPSIYEHFNSFQNRLQYIPKNNSDSPVIEHTVCKGSRKIPIEIGQYNFDTIFEGVSNIEVDAAFGHISVSTGIDQTTTLKSVINIDGKFRKHKGYYLYTYEKKGSHLKISFRAGSNINIVGRVVNLSGEFQITTPPGTTVNLRNTSGNITLKGLESKINTVECNYGHVLVENMSSLVNIIDRSGQVTANNIQGGLNIQANYGHVQAKDIIGLVNIVSGSGQINVSDVEGSCKLEARYGHVNINNVKGDVEIASTSGNIKAKKINGKQCNMISRYGHIDLKDIMASVDIESSSGNILLDEIEGDIKINGTYGKQHLKNLIGNVVTFSRSGDISIYNLNGNLELESIYGHVDLDECKGKIKIIMSSGDLNGLKLDLVESLDIHSKYGNVRIQLENSINDLSFELNAPSGNLQINKGDMKKTEKNSSLIIRHGKIMVKCYTANGSQIFI